jgi:CheY-like chemotaxis protein
MYPAAEILLVDDNPADIRLICEALAAGGRGSHVSIVLDGEEAVAFLRRSGKYAQAECPHLIILDLNLPRSDGRAVLAEVKADPGLRKIPVVVFTTSRSIHDIRCSYELGANCYVSKPGNLRDFFVAVQSLEQFWFGVVSLPG